MKVSNGKQHCALCGAELEAGPGEQLRTVIVGSSGRVNIRTVSVGNREIHRCESGLDSLRDSPIGERTR